MKKMIFGLICIASLSSFAGTKVTTKKAKKVIKTQKLKTTPIFKRSRSLASVTGVVISYETEVAKSAPKMQP